MPPSKAAVAKRKPLTLTQLASYDDILTDALIDHVYYWTTIPKNRSSYHPSRGVREDDITQIIQAEVVVNSDIDAGTTKLLQTDGLRRFVNGLKTEHEKADFTGHLRRYLSIYHPDCPFEVNTTNRYTIVSHEAAVTARRFIKRNETIKHLSGVQVVITPEEEKEMTARKKDFSIVVSARKKCASLFMGPARFANHDCNANAKLVTTGKAGIEIIAIRNIDVGEEITVTYADNYFGVNNSECLCCTCEKNQANGWANPECQVSVKTSIEGAAEEGYLLRKRRGVDSTDRSSRTPSVAPTIRPRVSKARLGKSACNSMANDSLAQDSVANDATNTGSPMPPPSSTKKRSYSSSIITPPFTPAKKLKLAADEAIPIHLDAQSTRGSSVQSQRSDSLASGNGSTTDITEPEKESPCPEVQTPKPLKVEPGLPTLKLEEGDERPATILAQTSLFSQNSQQIEVASLVAPAPVIAATRPVSAMSISAICNPPTPPSSQPLPSTEDALMATVETAEPITDPAPLIVKVEAATAEEEEQPKKKRKYMRRTFIKETTPPAKHRQPGDYTLTPLLLSEPLMAWIRCINCDTAFVQHNAYYTKSSCPRCERHSKLYGYIWPKTQKQGPRDKEERILDHRTVHRFVHRQDEAIIRGRGKKRAVSDVDTPATATEAATPERPMRKKRKTRNDEDEAEDGGDTAWEPSRRSGRARRVSNKASAM
ncbi:histone-lysine N-methyltransferase SET9 [Plectosphaerella plurivora]|uniref:Histone-lysine N-methyltransferase SET9 n=1 Tax=Plectosphaerella plurivora TaxID=936078 RepID=A0A9P8VHD0_9PEZI|nr:histone-lysine N-methyltransferase SET9 [Plectosphaerella plurivora]